MIIRPGWLCGAHINSRHLLPSRVFLRTATTRAHSSSSSFGSSKNQNEDALRQKYPVFDRIPLPKSRASGVAGAWISLLEGSLPPHLRHSQGLDTAASLNPGETAQLLLAAQRSANFDALHALGSVHQRWKSVVWIIKQLVDTFGKSSQSHRLPTLASWNNNVSTLADLTTRPVTLLHPGPLVAAQSSLTSLTSDPSKDELYHERLRHDALGQVWLSLGRMVVDCVPGDVVPEVLEIIAYLHHHGIMPTAIYSHSPSLDHSAVQHPPTLHLLSSRILTLLADASWRAREKLLIEEAKMGGGEYHSLRPEIPGAAYKVNIPGLRPEIWAELILWACLHGKWVDEGWQILAHIRSKETPSKWRPLSWRALMPDGQTAITDWVNLERSLNSNTASVTPEQLSEIDRTVSSEVVEAYVDALMACLDVDNTVTAMTPGAIFLRLVRLREFLGRSGLILNGGSWDVIINRCVQAHGDRILESMPTNTWMLSMLASQFGSEGQATIARDVSSSVMGGTSALLGFYHRALRHQIRLGDLEGALRVFQLFQEYTDTNKRESLATFFQQQCHNRPSASHGSLHHFTDNYPAIEFPAFDMQIPPTILGPLFELVADEKAFDFGRWLLHGDHIDGPLVPQDSFQDPHLFPALVRFAAVSDDAPLLNTLLKMNTSGSKFDVAIIRSFLNIQISRRRWDAVVRLLEYIKNSPPSCNWAAKNLAVMAAAMVRSRAQSHSDDSADTDLSQAQQIFSDMVRGQYASRNGDDRRTTVDLLLALLATVDPYWSRFCLSLKKVRSHTVVLISASVLNVLLRAVTDVYGSVAGRRLLGHVWSRPIRMAQYTERSQQLDLSTLRNFERTRTVIHFPDSGGDGGGSKHMALYGGSVIRTHSIKFIFRKAMMEMKEHVAREGSAALERACATALSGPPDRDFAQDYNTEGDISPAEMVVWSIRVLSRLGVSHHAIRRRLTGEFLPEHVDAMLMVLHEELRGDVQDDVHLDTDLGDEDPIAIE